MQRQIVPHFRSCSWEAISMPDSYRILELSRDSVIKTLSFTPPWLSPLPPYSETLALSSIQIF